MVYMHSDPTQETHDTHSGTAQLGNDQRVIYSYDAFKQPRIPATDAMTQHMTQPFWGTEMS